MEKETSLEANSRKISSIHQLHTQNCLLGYKSTCNETTAILMSDSPTYKKKPGKYYEKRQMHSQQK